MRTERDIEIHRTLQRGKGEQLEVRSRPRDRQLGLFKVRNGSNRRICVWTLFVVHVVLTQGNVK